MEQVFVTVREGTLRGFSEDGVRKFRGVPFAQPPVGELRWRAPRPPRSWTGVRPATEYPAMPCQNADWGGAYQSEDCLYLNIWAPEQAENAPVFVWFYGGSYQVGSASDPLYDGTYLAKKGVITITVNYRVGLFGFLCHPDMTEFGGQGNFGVSDQIAALRWIRDNIASFGGDPARVTAGGQSAGSASVNNMMVSPLARGLISGAINQSGDVFQPERDVPFSQAAESGVKLMRALGARNLDEMRRIPAERLLAPGVDAAAENGIICAAVIDGVVIPRSQGDMLLNNDAVNIPILIGTCADEGSAGPGNYRQRILARLELPESLYPDDSRETVMRLARDYWYGRHLAWVRIRTRDYGRKTWHYSFSRRRSGEGAQHGMEIPYVFGTLPRDQVGAPGGYTDGDLRLMERMSGYWVNFIRTGDPNGAGLPPWPEKGCEPVHMKFDLTGGMESDWFREECRTVCPAVEKWMRSRIR